MALCLIDYRNETDGKEMLFTEEESRDMTELSGHLLKGLVSCRTPKDAVASFYSEYKYPGEPEKRGMLCASAFGTYRNQFYEMIEAAGGDLLRFCQEHDPQPRRKGSMDDCSYWLRLDAAATLSATAAGGDRELVLRYLLMLEQTLGLPKEDRINVELGERLERRAVQSIRNSGLLFYGLGSLAQTLHTLAARHDGGRMLLDAGNRPAPLRLAADVVLHARFGLWTCSWLWAGTEILRTVEAVGQGTLPAAQGAEQVRRVGHMMAVDAVMYFYPDGIQIADALSKLDAVPDNIVRAAETASCVSKAAGPMLQAGSLGLDPMWVDLEMAAKGAQAVARYAQWNIIPETVAQSRRHLDWLLGLVDEERG